MRIFEVIQDKELDEAPASRKLCQSGKPNNALGASQLASCKSQGYRGRHGNKSHKIGNERTTVKGKRIKGKKYGGPLPDWRRIIWRFFLVTTFIKSGSKKHQLFY
jgi:hypothetical protein